MDVSATPTFGPLVVALFTAVWVSSSCVHLNLSYFRTTHDPWQWKLAVSFVTVASTVHTGILCWAVYEHLILHWGESDYLSQSTWAFSSHTVFLVAIGFIVQMYYAFKLSTLYKEPVRSWLVSAIAVFAAAQLAFGIVAAYNTVRTPVPLFAIDLDADLGWQTLSYLVFSVVCNVAIFIASIVDARDARFAVRSETVIEVASRYVVETNALATVASVLSLAFLVAWNITAGRASGLWMAFALLLPKLYVFSLLASHTRGAELTRLTVDYSKHASSLSDMFKGSPVSASAKPPRFPVTVSRIGAPQPQTSTTKRSTPIADLFSSGARGRRREGGQVVDVHPDSPGWLRRTFNPSAAAAAAPAGASEPRHLLSPPTAPFAAAASTSAAARHHSAAPTSISDYGEYFADDHDHDVPVLPSTLSKDGAQGGAGGYSTSVEVALSPRRAHFAPTTETKPGMGHDGATKGAVVPMSSIMGLNLAGRPPVKYGYL
ncbi:hypothetical protein JCM11491_000445 [Sporobolomyces phaffii]